MAKQLKSISEYEQIALVLQGGGALGAYQAGVVEGLTQQGVEPSWIAGISIGALNTAIIAGNPPEQRVAALRAFWHEICQPNYSQSLGVLTPWNRAMADTARTYVNGFEAARTMVEGQKGFFHPRFPLPIPGMGHYKADEVSYYQTEKLRTTLLKYADFNRINQGDIRVSVGAVNVATGNLIYFDNTEITLKPEHFMASGALPPGFPAVKIDDDYYWDGGLVSNTPLSQIIDNLSHKDTLVFQIDLWHARGKVPSSFLEIDERIKDIQYSSRTRMITDVLAKRLRTRQLIQGLLDKVPANKRDEVYRQADALLADDARVNIIQLIYQDKAYEGSFKDYEFSNLTMSEHWQSGLADVQHTFRHKDWFEMPSDEQMFVTHDVHRLSR